VLWWTLIGLAVAGAAVLAYAIFIERWWFRLGRYRLDILPAGEGDLSVLHLSDIHLVRDDRRTRRFLESLPQADVTVITGDILGEPEAVEFSVETLRPVRGRRASLFVLGSNDLYSPRLNNYLRYFVRNRKRRRRLGPHGRGPDLVRLLEADGWVHLRNRREGSAVDGLRMEVLGLDDPHIHRSDLTAAPRLDPEAFGLAVVHSPDPAPELTALGWDLVVAGHTHGGQVCLPVRRALVTNCSIPNRLASGLARLGPGYLHVSPGLGTSKYAPFRLFCRPEATLLELRRADASARHRA
jgi:predicted MPP superfamily phosphohydrolase